MTSKDSFTQLTLRSLIENSEVTLGRLAHRISEAEGLRVDEVARRIYRLIEEEKIHLEDTHPHKNILSYTLSLYSLWFWLLLLLMGLTGSSIYLLPPRPPFIYLRYVTGALSVLYLPGATFMEALFPNGEGLEPLERLTLSIGLSLALVPMVGLVLNYIAGGIRQNIVFLSLSGLTLILGVVALIRKFTSRGF